MHPACNAEAVPTELVAVIAHGVPLLREGAGRCVRSNITERVGLLWYLGQVSLLSGKRVVICEGRVSSLRNGCNTGGRVENRPHWRHRSR
jgi:hypothetical protein